MLNERVDADIKRIDTISNQINTAADSRVIALATLEVARNVVLLRSEILNMIDEIKAADAQ